MSLPAKIIIGLTGYAFQKFLDRYGEEIIAYAARRGEEAVREYTPIVARWTADKGTQFYGFAAPRAADAFSRLSALRGRPASGALVPGAEESDGRRLSTMVFGPFAGSLEQIGAIVRATAVAGIDELRSISDEEIGAIAVSLWRAQNMDTRLGRRLRRRLWQPTDSGQ